jgi:hypothetical protein
MAEVPLDTIYGKQARPVQAIEDRDCRVVFLPLAGSQ